MSTLNRIDQQMVEEVLPKGTTADSNPYDYGKMEIKPLERSHRNPDRESISVNIDNLNNFEADYKEAIEALELLMKGVEGLPPLTAITGSLRAEWLICLDVIENAYGESWEDIRRENGPDFPFNM